MKTRAMPFSLDRVRFFIFFFMAVLHGNSAATVGGIGWIRFAMPRLASVHALNTLRGDTFSSALVSSLEPLGHRIDQLGLHRERDGDVRDE